MFDPTAINVFAETNYRGQRRRFGIKLDDRRRHMYLVGKTGMGKSTVMERMIVNDMNAGHGIALVDPHGDLVEKMLDFVPSNRVNDIVYINPSDYEYPIGLHVLEAVHVPPRHLLPAGLMGDITKMSAPAWSARMEYILNNTILALLEYPGSTMLGIARMLVDPRYRTRVLTKVTDPIVKGFWVDEFANYNDKFRNEAVAPIQNKVGQFLSSAIIRNIVGQPKSTIDLREIMDSKKILLLNLAKGRIGEDNSSLLGAMMITRLQLAAMSRVDTPEAQRSDFFLYVDEFQNFATESFAGILSEARKYRLDLIIAHQYIEQLSEEVAPAVFGNVGTIMAFRVGGEDAEFLEKEFEPTFMQTDLVNLPKYEVYLKLMIDGVASEPFSATTLPPFELQPTNNREKVIQASRERYAQKRTEVEEKILRWSGVEEVYRASAEEENIAVQQEESIYRPEGKKRRPPKDLFQRDSVVVEPVVAEQRQPTIHLADLAARATQHVPAYGRGAKPVQDRRPGTAPRQNFPRPSVPPRNGDRRVFQPQPPQHLPPTPDAKVEEPRAVTPPDEGKPKTEKRLDFGQTVKF